MSARRLCGLIPLVSLAILGVTGLSVGAHGIEEKDLAVVDHVSECTDQGERAERLDCFASLCTPGKACSDAIIIAATEQEGASVGFTVINDLLTDGARFGVVTDGHDLAHLVGRQTAKHSGFTGEAFMLCPQDFYYGCQHGFFEAVLAKAASWQEAAKQICGSLPANQQFFCYHGVGHGLMMAKAYKLDETLGECDLLPALTEQQACWQGTLMENVNSELRGEARSGVFSEENLLAPCDRLDTKYQWECYMNHAGYLMTEAKGSMVEATRVCMKIPSALPREACLRGLGQLASNPGWQKFMRTADYDEAKFSEMAIELCRAFPEGEVDICHSAAIINLLNYKGAPQAVEICGKLPSDESDYCYREIVKGAAHPMFSREERIEMCLLLPDRYKAACFPKPEAGKGLWAGVKQFFHSMITSITSLWKEEAPPRAIEQSAGSSSAAELSPSASETRIEYDRQVFSPSTVHINVGEAVRWVALDGEAMWPASNDHPTHELYSAFDPGRPVVGSDGWAFTFTKKGTWKFHDHLYPQAGGEVIVE